jgi:hypothetical protein
MDLMLDTDATQTSYEDALAAAADDDGRENLSAMRHYAQGYATAKFEAIDGSEFTRPDQSLAFGYLYAAYKAQGGPLLIWDYFVEQHRA